MEYFPHLLSQPALRRRPFANTPSPIASLSTAPRRYSGLLDLPFWPMLQFSLHPTRLPQQLSHQPLRLPCVRFLQLSQICIHAHNWRSRERYWIASERWSEVSLSDPAKSAIVRDTFNIRS